ncbi:MAG: aldehyde dehydrogenase family protein, partial [Rubripirellula sp.]
MISKLHPYYLAGVATTSADQLPVVNKYTQEIASHVALADSKAIEFAVNAAVAARQPMQDLAPFEKKAILQHCSMRFRERYDELAMCLCIEAGKPIKDSRGEVDRLIDTFEIAAEEAVRIGGELINLEISPRAKGYRGMYQRVPVGVCSLITPFNFPLNLVAHKIAPAIAAGCPFILKPASNTPISSLLIGEILCETKLPTGAFSILPCNRQTSAQLVTDDRIQLLSFTGSPEVGWQLKRDAGRKKVTLELGGNAACIIDEDTDLEDACGRLMIGAFYQSGQSCIGVQRIMIHQKIYNKMKERLVRETEQLVCGDPRNESTFIGPLISEKEATRLQKWIQDAKQLGGKILCGGTRVGAMMQPTLMEDVPSNALVCRKEAFGPIAILSSFDHFEQAIEETNDSDFGLQAGVFTRDLYKANQAWDQLEVGGVIIGDVPSWRVDHMPYGGVKESGLGREGIRYAIEEMTEIRNLVIRTPTKHM